MTEAGEGGAVRRVSKARVAMGSGELRINVTLPAHNEAAGLAGSVRRVAAWLARWREWPMAWPVAGVTWELVVAENGSTDETRAVAERVARELAGQSGLEVQVWHREVAGRGGALKEVWQASGADILSYMDVDLSTDLEELPRLLGPLVAGEAEVAIGSRLAAGARTTRSWRREVLSRGYNALLHVLLGLRVKDAQCGFKAVRREAAERLLPVVRDEGWFFDTELLWRAQEAGMRVAEVPVRWVEDRDSRVRLWPTIREDWRGVWRLRRERRRRGREGGRRG